MGKIGQCYCISTCTHRNPSPHQEEVRQTDTHTPLLTLGWGDKSGSVIFFFILTVENCASEMVLANNKQHIWMQLDRSFTKLTPLSCYSSVCAQETQNINLEGTSSI